MDNKIGAIIVLYRPNLKLIYKVAESLAKQVNELCIVDNTPGADNSIIFTNLPSVTYISLGDNRGLAAAQNIGINHLSAKNMDFIVFSDQDSLPPKDMVSNLLKAYLTIEASGIKVAAVGPMPIQRSTEKPTFDRLSVRFKRRLDNIDVMCMNNIISSGSLMRVSTIQLVGPMLEFLFIDGIDSEWCWRARYKYGLQSFIIPEIKLSHMSGEDTEGRHRILIPTPFRVYYQYRNYIILLSYPQTPTWWKFKNGIKYIIKSVYFPLFLKPRTEFIKKIVTGIRDGLKYIS
ncbi:MAG: glycosyltransferase family 2 protein [Muribaculaceae bacterium]|nr:glycosyltransferase family 2 protein [Muribaculaceae bacterium]